MDALVNSIAPSVAYGYGSYLVILGRISFGEMVASAQYLTRGVDSIGSLIAVLGRIKPIQIHAEKVLSVLASEPANENTKDSWPYENISTVTLEKVSFRYSDSTAPLLNSVDLAITAGEIVALCGPSGAGKSTLGHLVCGLLQPVSGHVLADGHCITESLRRAYRTRTALVTERDHVFIGSVRENLIIVNPTATDSQAEESLFLSMFDRVVSSLPKGLDTQVGRGGQELSSGEKQRLSLARAILRNPDVVVLDEITANIDPSMEELLFQRLLPWLRKRIVLLISHRQQTLRWGDRIVQLVDGHLQNYCGEERQGG